MEFARGVHLSSKKHGYEKVKNNFRGGRHELAHHFGLGLFFVLVNEKKQGYLSHHVPQHPAWMRVSHLDGRRIFSRELPLQDSGKSCGLH